MHIQGSQLTLRNVRASLQTYSLRAPPSCLGLQQRWKQPSPSTCQIGQSRQANALRLRLDPGNYVGDRVESVDPDRANVPCTLFLYRGTFSARQFSDVLVPLQTGDPCRLTGAGQATRTSWSRFHGYLEQVLVASTARTRYEMPHTLFTWFLFGASCTMQLAFASYAYDFECVSVSS